MEDLNFPPRTRNRLKFFAKNSGLILFAGLLGHGKTTSANSVLEYYMRLYGDTAITVEQPCEYNLQDREWSRGSKCYQYEVYEDKDWLTNLEKGLELQPRYIYFGEMITPEATARALELASDGNHLVISTVTADTIEHALMRVRDLAEKHVGDKADEMLAEAILSCVAPRFI